ncbi:hypothetical protein [Geopsychrobacter electrodiphilus]|uniref:hypothetical protein n=1 Tax=Geopsychrobacter electrodiphilus TaxID=225196 RepID=UPI000379983B|nr:hypothetical protein [Geopsychrobacter electrodiphilus]
MPRIARIIAPGYAHHVTRHGNNRAQVFFDNENYLWSSARAHLGGSPDERLKLTDWIDPAEREACALFVMTEDAAHNNAIRKATGTGRPLGTEAFVDTLEYELNRAVRVKKAGRPKKNS